jgi:hypothetical protein
VKTEIAENPMKSRLKNNFMIQNTKIRTIGIGGNTSITIDIKVGNAQPSSTTIYHNGALLITKPNDFSYTVNNIQKGQQIHVVTTASDIPQNSDVIIVTHTVQNPNDVVNYNDQVSPNDIAINTTKYYLF